MSGKVRVYEVAKQLNLDPKQVVGLFQAIGVAEVRNHMSSVEPDAVERVKRHLEKQRTHDVVEERIRTDGRVVKRRAVAKPGAPAPAEAPSVPSAPAAPRSRLRVHLLASRTPERCAARPTGGLSIEPVVASRSRERASSARGGASERQSTCEVPVARSSARALPVEEPAELLVGAASAHPRTPSSGRRTTPSLRPLLLPWSRRPPVAPAAAPPSPPPPAPAAEGGPRTRRARRRPRRASSTGRAGPASRCLPRAASPRARRPRSPTCRAGCSTIRARARAAGRASDATCARQGSSRAGR